MPLCAACVQRQGLCASCAAHDRSILPQLAENPLVKLMAERGANDGYIAPAPAPSREGERIRQRKERKRARRLQRALLGQRTYTRTAA